MLHEPKMPSKQMRHHFWAQRAPTQHRSSGNSAAAAPATVFAAFGHDPGALSCCLVSRALQTTQLPPKQMHSDFWANVRHKALFALQLSISSTSTTALCASMCQHPSVVPAPQSCCFASDMLEAPQMPTNQMRSNFWVACALLRSKSAQTPHLPVLLPTTSFVSIPSSMPTRCDSCACTKRISQTI